MITWLYIPGRGGRRTGPEREWDHVPWQPAEPSVGECCRYRLFSVSDNDFQPCSVFTLITMFSLKVAATAVRTAAGDWVTTVTTTQVYFEKNLRRKAFPADNNIIISSYHYLIIILSSCQASSQTPPFHCPSNSTRLGTNYPRTPSYPGNFCSMCIFSHTYISRDYFSLT